MSNCPTCGAPKKQRSRETHDHYFACVAAAFETLPEAVEPDFADADHLRKWALIKAGYRKQRSVLCETEEEAARLMMLGKALDNHSFLERRGSIVTVYSAESQSYKAMGKERFAQSKEAVLKILSELLGVDVAELAAAA